MIFNNELITFFEANQNLILSSCLGTSIQFNTVYQKKKNINRYINFAPAELSLGFQRKTRKKRLLQNWFFLRIQYNSPKKVAILEHPFYPGRRNIEALTRKQNTPRTYKDCHDPKCGYHDVPFMLLNGSSLCILIVL